MPHAFQHLSNFTSMSMTTAPGRTYKYYTGPAALWGFGFGLSYTTFSLAWGDTGSAPNITLTPFTDAQATSVVVTNTGTSMVRSMPATTIVLHVVAVHTPRTEYTQTRITYMLT
eukprot:m.590088 g.590088  ORF g.590088 m.590088 type:complete len:114 (+) comp22375_c0_seq3:383-724(+)